MKPYRATDEDDATFFDAPPEREKPDGELPILTLQSSEVSVTASGETSEAARESIVFLLGEWKKLRRENR